MLQWLKVHLSMQATWVRSLVREDSTGHGAAKPVCHNYRAHSPEPMLCKREGATMRSLCTASERSPHSLQLEKSPPSNEDPAGSGMSVRARTGTITRLTAPQRHSGRAVLGVLAPTPQASHTGSHGRDNNSPKHVLFSRISGEA